MDKENMDTMKAMIGSESFLKKYFSANAWSRLMTLRLRDEEPLIPEEWTELFKQANSFIGADLRAENAQAWADQCHEAWLKWTDGDVSIQAGFDRALMD